MGNLSASKKEEASYERREKTNGFASVYRQSRECWVRWMERHTAGLAPRGWFLVIALFILLTGGYSLLLAVRSIYGKGSGLLLVTRIQKPDAVTIGKGKDYGPAGPGAALQRIQKFSRYMDSLSGSPGGRKVYDSIRKSRPGLMDSIQILENLYGTATKTNSNE